MGNSFEHKNIGIFKYADKESAGPAEEAQALRDWNRLAESGNKCTYFINGVSLSQIRKDKGFSDIHELRTFFIENLFSNVKDATEQAKLAETACHHFNQAGLTHATNFCIKNLSTDNQRIKVGDPSTRIDFKPTDHGVSITEENTYKKWTEIVGAGIKPHACALAKEYYAKTTTSYLFTEQEIKLVNLTIDCPSKNLAPIFDKRPENEQPSRNVGSGFSRTIGSDYLKHMVEAFLKWVMSKAEIPSEQPDLTESKTIYRQ